MAAIHKSVLLRFSPAQMYKLVERVEDYPKFLPWCSGSKVAERKKASMLATLDIRFGGVEESFTTENALVPNQSISMHLRDGPFSKLVGHWQFTALGDKGCKVEFRVEYEFSNIILETLVGPAFQHIASSMVDSFTKRAEEVYA